MAKGNPIGWFEIMGGDAAATQKFYRELFDWKVDANNPMNYGMVEAAEGGIGGGVGGAMDGGAARVTVYADVDDLQATLDKAVSLGGSVVSPPMEVPGQGGLTIAHFQDPNGNVIGIMKTPAM